MHTPLEPPHYGIAPGYNFLGSQGFCHEALAVQEAIGQGLLQHPEMPLSETLAMARVFDDIRAPARATAVGHQPCPPGRSALPRP